MPQSRDSSRSFPTPWRLIELAEVFRVKDASGFPAAYVDFCDDDERRASMPERMMKDDARRIALNVANLPDLVGK